MIRIASLLPALAVAGVSSGFVAPAVAGLFQQHHHFHAASGQPVVVGEHAVLTRTCQSSGQPLITANPGPAHGTITMSAGSHVVTESVGSAQCSGREVPDTHVFYTSAPGYQGRDRFHLTIRLGATTIEDEISVSVR